MRFACLTVSESTVVSSEKPLKLAGAFLFYGQTFSSDMSPRYQFTTGVSISNRTNNGNRNIWSTIDTRNSDLE